MPEKELCLNRLPVEYQPDAPAPNKWLEFLDGLLIPEDILTLQEYLGYLLIPSTKAQKMLVMTGKGGEEMCIRDRRCIDAQGTDAEAGFFPVQFFLALQHLHGAGVEVGVLRAPQSRAVHAVPEGDSSAFTGLEQEAVSYTHLRECRA